MICERIIAECRSRALNAVWVPDPLRPEVKPIPCTCEIEVRTMIRSLSDYELWLLSWEFPGRFSRYDTRETLVRALTACVWNRLVKATRKSF